MLRYSGDYRGVLPGHHPRRRRWTADRLGTPHRRRKARRAGCLYGGRGARRGLHQSGRGGGRRTGKLAVPAGQAGPAKVRERLEAEGIPYSYLDGSTRDRAAAVQGFKDCIDPVFLISLKAGGFGLNLTEADYCFVLDPWWNPATEAQAIDRTHRIGQARLFSSVLDDGNVFGTTFDAEDIRLLFS